MASFLSSSTRYIRAPISPRMYFTEVPFCSSLAPPMSTKKKVLYVRGPDNVYRRQSDSHSLVSKDTAEIARQKNQVDSTLNDLIECGFKLHNSDSEKDNHVGQDPSLTAHQDQKSAVAENTRKGQIHHNNTATNNNPSNGGLPVRTSSPHAESGNAANLPPATRASSWFLDYFVYFIDLSNVNMISLHQRNWLELLVPYVLGVASAYLVSNNKDLIVFYMAVLLKALKIGLLWLVFTGIVCYYAGIFDVSKNTELSLWLQTLKTRLNYKNDASNAAEPPIDKHSSVHSDQASNSPSSDEAMSITPSYDSNKDDVKSVETRKSIPESKIVNVRPYVPSSRKDTDKSRKLPSAPEPRRPEVPQQKPELHKHHTEPENLKRKHPRSHALDKHRPKDPRRHSSASLDLANNSKQRSLPRIKSDFPSSDHDLPLVYEVRLRDNYDSLPDVDPIPGLNTGLDRLGSVMSKQSVLGTRANYNRFLQNVREA